MKKIILIIFILCRTFIFAQTPPPNGIIAYAVNSGDCTGSCNLTNYSNFFVNNYQIIIRPGLDLSTYLLPGEALTTYVDGQFIYMPLIYQFVYGTATTQGFTDPEGLLLHMTNADYTVSGMYNGIDQFDGYEQTFTQSSGTPLAAVNGVYTLTSGVYVDRTVDAYCPASNCSHSASPITVSDQLLIGYQVPFGIINLTINTPISGGTVTYYICTAMGTCTIPLTPISDTTKVGGLPLKQSGTITFTPPATWVRAVQNTSQAKYFIDIAVTGSPSTNPIIGRITGDTMLTAGKARAWNPSTCSGGTVNTGDLTWCVTPSATASAHSRQQARAIGYGGGTLNDFIASVNNVQGGKNTWSYVNQVRTTAALIKQGFAGTNGVMFDNSGAILSQTPAFSPTNSDLNATGGSYSTYTAAAVLMLAATYNLLNAQYGVSPIWWSGVNSFGVNPSTSHGIYASMNWSLSELHNITFNSYNIGAVGTEADINTSSLWGPVGTNPNSTMLIDQIQDDQQFGQKDGNCTSSCTLTNYHLWPMDSRGPNHAFGMYMLVKNPNLLFAYDPSGSDYLGTDEYYTWVTSARTLASPGISAQICTTGSCTINLSGALETSTCPGQNAFDCPIRLGGVDVVGALSYSGTTLTLQGGGAGPSAILNSYTAGASIEYMVKVHNSITPPSMSTNPVAMYGYFLPISTINFGVPDTTASTYLPCTGNGIIVTGGCIIASGSAISGNTSPITGCEGGGVAPNYKCSPLLGRYFTGGTNGNTVVLLRPITTANTPIASSEYETPSIPITLPNCYYQVFVNGTISGSCVTSTTLRAGDTFIGVTLSGPIAPGNYQNVTLNNTAIQ